MTIDIASGETNSIRLKEQVSAPATPASGYGQLYEKTDGMLYFKNAAGVESVVKTPVIGKLGTTTTVSNSIVETTVFSGVTIPAGSLGLHGALRIKILYNLRHDTTCNTTFNFKLGASVAATIIHAQGSTDPNKPSVMDVLISNTGGAGTQHYTITVMYKDSTYKFLYAEGSSSIDTTEALTFTITVQHSVANANNTYVQNYILVEQL